MGYAKLCNFYCAPYAYISENVVSCSFYQVSKFQKVILSVALQLKLSGAPFLNTSKSL